MLANRGAKAGLPDDARRALRAAAIEDAFGPELAADAAEETRSTELDAALKESILAGLRKELTSRWKSEPAKWKIHCVERGEDTGVFSDVRRGTRRAHAPKRVVGREAAARGRRIATVGERRWR